MHDWTQVIPNHYHAFHVAWLASLQAALNGGLLPDGYMALAEQVVPSAAPDILTVALPDAPTFSHDAGAVALAPSVPLTGTLRRPKLRVPERTIAIRDTEDGRMVAVIELVSPANKGSRRDFVSFLGKTIDFLRQGIHVLLIDPFPPTPRDPAGLHDALWRQVARKRYAPPTGKPLTLAAYANGPQWKAFVEPFAVGDPLHPMPLFLTPNRWVDVPLEATYQVAWAGMPGFVRNLLTG